MTPFYLHLISDSTGETVVTVARAALVQFDSLRANEHMWSMIRTSNQVAEVLAGIKARPGFVLYTLVNPELRTALRTRSAMHCLARSHRWGPRSLFGCRGAGDTRASARHGR